MTIILVWYVVLNSNGFIAAKACYLTRRENTIQCAAARACRHVWNVSRPLGMLRIHDCRKRASVLLP